MPLTFAGTLDRDALLRATAALAGLVAAPEVAEAWDRESALAGMTVGGVTRHLVSQPESAVEFLGIRPVPPRAPVVSLAELYERTDWFAAAVDAEENTSIRDHFNAMAGGSAGALGRDPGAGSRGAAGRRRGRGRDDVRAVAGLLAGHRRLPRGATDGARGPRRRPGGERRPADADVRRRGAAPGARVARAAGRAAARAGRDGPALSRAERAGRPAAAF
jgi:hypothetical protein